ncbi:MAG: MFS transporter, partial [Chlamydiia bacterium]
MQCSIAGLRKSFFVDLFTLVQSWLGFSLVFPIFAPLLFSVDTLYYSFNDSLIFKTSVLGSLYGLYGVGQGFGALIWSYCSRLLGKRGGQILWSLFMLMGYLVMCLGLYEEHLAALIAGRLLTGIGSAAIWIGRSAV